MLFNTILDRIFQKHNFSFDEVMLNIKSVLYPSYNINFKKEGIDVLNVDDTIDIIINKKLSIARFGDGEISIMRKDHGVGFQKKDDLLADKLFEVFNSSIPNLLIGLPDQLLYIQNSDRVNRKFWISFLSKHQHFLIKHLNKSITYGNAHITRFYIAFKDKKKAFSRFERLKKFWEEKDILIVEGELTRSGVGNDLYKKTKSIQRLICPAKNAFDVYGQIFNEIKRHGSNKLILLSLGPTATVLAHDLSLEGFWVIDLGHLDVEYMWMLSNAKDKTNIKGRYVNEMDINHYIEELDAELLIDYNNQIISRILI